MSQIIELLKGTEYQIVAQVVNAFKKVLYVSTKQAILIPVQQTGIVLGDISAIRFTKDMKYLPTMETYIKHIKNINDILVKSNNEVISITSVTLDESNSLITSILTHFGQLVPVKPTQYQSGKVLPYKYYQFVDDEVIKNVVSNRQTEYIRSNEVIKEYINKLKVKFGAEFAKNVELVNEIRAIITSQNTSRQDKVSKVTEMMMRVLGDVPKDRIIEFAMQHIANDIVNDNVRNSLLNNIIDTGPLQLSENESLLKNIVDIREWIKKNRIRENDNDNDNVDIEQNNEEEVEEDVAVEDEYD
jgi:hypothetical protein